MSQTNQQQLGARGEEIAARFLLLHDYTILERNYRKRFGEIDIIARHRKPLHGDTICFVEVKTRRTADGSAERATNPAKLRRFFLAARDYCRVHDIDTERVPIQFEQVSVIVDEDEEASCLLYTIPID